MAPFPWLPMMAVAIGLTSHSFCLTNLFPYAGYMVRHLGVTDDKDAAGYYAGYLASAFMLGRLICSYSWGRFSDRYGRLPVYNIGLWTMVLAQIAFGLSTNYNWAITTRFLLGALNGMMATSKTMIFEICGPEHEVVGMTFITATWSIGFVIGPAAGGLLAEPAVHYPHLFSQTGIFGRFPYLLPNLVAAGLALLALPMSHLFLYETHPSLGVRVDANKRTGFKPLSTFEPFAEDGDVAESGTARTVSLPPQRGSVMDHPESSGKSSQAKMDEIGAPPIFEEVPGTQVENEEGKDAAKVVRKQDAGEQNGDGHEGSSMGMVPLQSRSNNDGPLEIEAREKDEAPRCWRACLSPLRLLSQKRVREVMVVYVFFAVRSKVKYGVGVLSNSRGP